jgi:hypothetical protein
VFGLKPAMPKGRPTKAQQAEIDAWRQKVIDSGQSRSSADASNYDLKTKYPSLQREVDYGPEPEFKKGGSTTPEDMRDVVTILYNNLDVNGKVHSLVSKHLFNNVKRFHNKIERAIDMSRDYLFDYFA